MKLVVGLCVGTIAFLHYVYAVPDPEVLRRYNAKEVPELSMISAGINITYKLINRGNGLVEGSKKQQSSGFGVLSNWEKNPVLREGSTLYPKQSNIQYSSMRLDFKGGYGNGDGRYGDFQLRINKVTGNKSSIGSVQISTALVKKKPRILFQLMVHSFVKAMTVFVNPSTGL